MIRDLAIILGPLHQAALRRYLVWLGGYAILDGVATVLIVPVLAALLGDDPAAALRWILIMAAVVAVACVARYRQAMDGFSLALAVLSTVHRRLGAHVVRLPLGWFTGQSVGRLAQSATEGAVMVSNVFVHLLAPVVVSVLTPATIAAATLLLDWRLGAVLAASAPLIYGAHRWSATAIGRSEEAVDAAATRASARVVEFARTQAVLRAFGRTVDGYQPLDLALDAQRRASGSMLKHTFPRLLAGGLSVQAAFAVLIAIGCLLVLGGEADAVQVIALLALAARFAGPLAEAGARSGLLRMAGNDLRRLAAILSEPPLPEPATPLPVVTPGEVVFEAVRFGYRPDEPILRDVSVRVPPRTMTAIVGPSGAGKTTLLRLILRFFDVQAGVVRVGGTDVRALSGESLMSQVSVVMQDVYLFDDTLEANIRLGRPTATDAEVREAARAAGVDEIVQRLPAGWQTRVGEGGALLSGGERQRVSLARALVKDAPIVLLDEATSALDPENDRYIGATIRRLRQRATVIVVAHRLQTVAEADQIMVLDDGGVTECGTHDELMRQGGRYAALWHNLNRAEGWRIAPAHRGE